MLEISIGNRLRANSAVAARVQNRAYHLYMHQNPIYPAVTYHKTGERWQQALDGPVGLADAGFQFDCWAANGIDAINLANDVAGAIQGWNEVTSEGDTVYGAVFLNEFDNIENIITDEQTMIYVRSVNMNITYKNA